MPLLPIGSLLNSGQPVQPTQQDIPLLSSTVGQILGFEAQATSNTAAATGAGYEAQGAGAEAGAYGTAAGIANQNAQLEAVAGQLQNLQQTRLAQKTIGAQQAANAGAGFQMSGSSLAALQSSYRQLYLTQQLNNTQTLMTQGGFLEQAAAAQAEQTSATASQNALLAEQSAYTTAAGSETQQADAATQALISYLQATGAVSGTPGSPLTSSTTENLTPAAAVTLSALQGQPGVPNLPAPSWYQTPQGQWLYGQPGSLASEQGGGGSLLPNPLNQPQIQGPVPLNLPSPLTTAFGSSVGGFNRVGTVSI